MAKPADETKKPSRHPRLVQGIDFYIEQGNFVFTPQYHLKRGYCCNSGCRHCPYKDGAMPKLDVVILGVEEDSKG